MNMFKKPKITQVVAPPPPPVPTIDQAANSEEYSRKVRRRRGHMANSTGAAAGASVASRALLG
jgi:hypothetical protein